ncbi:MAG: glycosyltransferase family 4 protein [Rhodospirillales bacterium]|jgi:glycosyltransferase involved in cell wall biosynthesis|nr:glycosyltransferase family 4 protein [Rhodospirillales bacterium]MDP6841492.1 glycosyltransferase family 4 protein [Rhodospirillales bacterium]|tara:strand:- start:682 stop:1896 length:1215 start_codon:yes stop_codon:yes gene_type:complete
MDNESDHTIEEAAPESKTGAAEARPPTVLQVLPALVTGGVERGTVDIAEAIVQAGGRALVVSEGGPMVGELNRAGAEHFVLPLATKNPFAIYKNIAHLSELITREQVDIVHARSRAPAWSAWHAAKRTGRAFITTFHGTYGHTSAAKRWYNSIMTRGERVIAISDFIGGHVHQVYGVSAARIRVVHRGIDMIRFDAANINSERVIHLAEAWRLPDGQPVVMLPGRLTRWKGQSVFIEAVKRLNRPGVQFLMVGSDQGRYDYRRELEQHIEAEGMTGMIHVIDHCDDMPAAYMLTDVVVSASTEPEAFGRVVAEAQALGRPVIATDHGGARETVIDGETGWLTKPGDADSLARAMALALDQSDEDRQAFAERSVAHIRKNFSKDRMCAETLEVYEEVLSERGRTQ